MSSRSHAEQMTRKATAAILSLVYRSGSYTLREIVHLLEADHSPELIRKLLYRLRDQKLVSGGAYEGYALTNKGLQRLQKLDLHLLPHSKSWDQHWRLVIYDIPEDMRVARNRVRHLIKQLGFKQLQQSVWAHPLPCLQEFQKIQEAYGIANHLLLIETPHNESHQALLASFRKIYPKL